MSDLQLEIKNLIIDALGLEDMVAEDIAADLTLFGEGLGLDSVDALELGLAIQKRFGIKIDAEAKDTTWPAWRLSSPRNRQPEDVRDAKP
jgi:acyl carrier protein